MVMYKSCNTLEGKAWRSMLASIIEGESSIEVGMVEVRFKGSKRDQERRGPCL